MEENHGVYMNSKHLCLQNNRNSAQEKYFSYHSKHLIRRKMLAIQCYLHLNVQATSLQLLYIYNLFNSVNLSTIVHHQGCLKHLLLKCNWNKFSLATKIYL